MWGASLPSGGSSTTRSLPVNSLPPKLLHIRFFSFAIKIGIFLKPQDVTKGNLAPLPRRTAKPVYLLTLVVGKESTAFMQLPGKEEGLPLETRPDSPGEPGMQPRDPCLPWRGILGPGHTPR